MNQLDCIAFGEHLRIARERANADNRHAVHFDPGERLASI